MRCFLTGATGFVGGKLAEHLLAAGHEVHALVRTPNKATALHAAGATIHAGDVTDKESMRRPMTGADVVFHSAGWYKIGVRDKRDAVAVNVDGTRHVLELMAELGIPKGVYTSTLAVNSDTHGRVVDETYKFSGTHVTVYDHTKADAHKVAEAFIARGLPLVIVQPGIVYGPGDTSGVRTVWIQFLQRKLPLLPRKTAYAWAHVDDIALGHILAFTEGRPGRNYFLAGPVHTLEDAIDIASEITGIPAPRLRVAPGVLRGAAAMVRPLEKIVPIPSGYTSEGLRVVAGLTYVGSNERAKRELGWSPRSLRDGLAETLRHEMRLLGMAPSF